MDIEQIKSALKRHMDKGETRERAFQKVRTANYKAIVEWEEHIESIVQRFEGKPPKEWASVIDSCLGAIRLERQVLRDLDNLEQTDWAK